MIRRRRRRRSTPEERLMRDIMEDLTGRRRRRRGVLPLVIAALLVVAGWWVWDTFLRRRHPVGPTVRVATWNVRHFSDRDTLDLRTVADVIRSSNFDLVAIQEVKQAGEQVDQLLNVLGSPWRAARLSEQTGNHERFVFVYHGDRVSEVAAPHFIASADAKVFDRTPYQCSFRAGQFDFTLVNVHLSYGDRARRQREAKALAAFAQDLARRQDEKDVIVLGDFNEEIRGNLHFFEDNGWEILNTAPTNLSAREAYDTLVVDPDFTFEWSGVAGAIPFDDTHFAGDDRAASAAVSDHRPAYADFVTNLPDDD